MPDAASAGLHARDRAGRVAPLIACSGRRVTVPDYMRAIEPDALRRSSRDYIHANRAGGKPRLIARSRNRRLGNMARNTS